MNVQALCTLRMKMKKIKPAFPLGAALGAAVLLVNPFNARSEDITDLAGKTYVHAELVLVEPDGLTLKHDGGLSKVYFGELPEEIQKKHGYKPEKAEAFRKQQQLSQKEHEKSDQAINKERPESRKKEDIAPDFPVWVHNIEPIKGRISRVEFDVQNNTMDDLIIRVHYKDIFIKGGETLKNQRISFSRSLDFMNVDAGGKTKTYRVDWTEGL